MDINEAIKLAEPTNVSRETLVELWRFCEAVMQWNRNFNLVSRQVTLTQLWKEHVLDSLQLSEYFPPVLGVKGDIMACKKRKIMDIGSGAGFPGMVLAILGYPCILVERSFKKSVFLKEAARVFNVAECSILNDDVKYLLAEKYLPEVGYIVSRAVTSVENIFDLSAHFIDENTKILLLKSKHQAKEVKQLHCRWRFKLQEHINKYKSEGVVVEISEITRK